MWQKHFKIAERQFESGKHKSVEEHALKALTAAREANNDQQVAVTLSLLSRFYMETGNPKAAETFREAVATAEKAYGPSSAELAEELEIFSCCLEELPNLEEAESVLLRALEIRESNQQDQQAIMTALDFLSEFYTKQNKHIEAEKYSRRALEIRKEIYGATSCELESIVEDYIQVLYALGRDDEALALEVILDDNLPQEIEDILASLEGGDAADLDGAIQRVRAELTKLLAQTEVRQDSCAEDHPFFELRKRALLFSPSYAKSVLARLIRMKAMIEQKPEILSEAAELSREVLAFLDTPDERTRLMLALIEMAKANEAHYAELDELLADAQPSAATLYTRALMLFRRYGSTAESKKAFKKALEYNPYVVTMLVGGEDLDVPDEIEPRTMGEAAAYCVDAILLWQTTPGISDFMFEVMSQAMPAGTR